MLNLGQLADKANARTRPLSGKNANMPDVHVHNYLGDNSTHYAPSPGVHAHPFRPVGKRGRPDFYSDDDDSDADPIKIDEMLQEIHKAMPAFEFLQYKDALLSKGICYCRTLWILIRAIMWRILG